MITSATNPKLKLVRALLDKPKIRREEQLFVLDGVRLVQDALDAGLLPDWVLYREDLAELGLLAALRAEHVACIPVTTALFNDLSDTQTPQGIMAICPWLNLAPPEHMDFVLIFDQLTNPGNLGSAMRTAAAVGVDAVILTPNSVDPYNPKVVRGAMGAHLRVPILQWTWEDIIATGLPLYVADAHGTMSLYALDLTQPCGIVVGGEAHGPQTEARRAARHIVSIPMEAGESLNATVAASVMLYEVYRQRHFVG